MENTLNFDDYLAIAKRRIWYVLIPFVLVLVMAVLVVNSLPPVYRSSATVAVESQQIPEGLVQSTVIGYADERIGFIRQRVMTNARLLEVIEKFGLFSEERGEVPASVLVARFRSRIFLDTIRDRSITRRNASPTVAFTLAFEDGDPETAAAVANELVTMFLAENVKTRTARATETTEFLKREAMRLSEQVSALEARVAVYKQAHSDALPEHLALRMNMLQRSETEFKDLEQEIETLEGEKRFLETQRVSVGAILSAGGSSETIAMSPAQQLAALKVELIEKSAVYAAAHPDLRSLRRRIALLEREAATQPGSGESDPAATATDPARAQIESQIISATNRLASLREQKQELKAKIETLEERIIETPEVERGLKDLARNYETAMEEYEEISSKQRHAELAENLEEEEKAERFVLLEPPQVPSVPVRPEKPKLYAVGFVLAAGGGAGTALLAEVLDKTIRGPAMLSSILQRHPLAVIPFIDSLRDRRKRRVRQGRLLVIALLAMIVALVVVHLFYEPLDVLLRPLFAAVGLA